MGEISDWSAVIHVLHKCGSRKKFPLKVSLKSNKGHVKHGKEYDLIRKDITMKHYVGSIMLVFSKEREAS